MRIQSPQASKLGSEVSEFKEVICELKDFYVHLSVPKKCQPLLCQSKYLSINTENQSLKIHLHKS